MLINVINPQCNSIITTAITQEQDNEKPDLNTFPVETVEISVEVEAEEIEPYSSVQTDIKQLTICNLDVDRFCSQSWYLMYRFFVVRGLLSDSMETVPCFIGKY